MAESRASNVQHEKWPSLVFKDGLWTLRKKVRPLPGVCPVHQCRHVAEEDRPLAPCSKCRKRLSRLNNPFAARWNTIKHRALARGQEFSITVSDLVECIERAGRTEDFIKDPSYIHIDRADCLKGYTVDNIQALTQEENLAKAPREKLIHFEEREKTQGQETCPF